MEMEQGLSVTFKLPAASSTSYPFQANRNFYMSVYVFRCGQYMVWGSNDLKHPPMLILPDLCPWELLHKKNEFNGFKCIIGGAE